MTRDELAAHHIVNYGRDFNASGDGYDDMDLNSGKGWLAVSAWGQDGWDLGDWPYVVLSVCNVDNHFHLLSVVEGDHSVYSFATLADREAALDYLFAWYAAGGRLEEFKDLDRQALDRGDLLIDQKFRGPYSSDRS